MSIGTIQMWWIFTDLIDCSHHSPAHCPHFAQCPQVPPGVITNALKLKFSSAILIVSQLYGAWIAIGSCIEDLLAFGCVVKPAEGAKVASVLPAAEQAVR